MGGHLSEAHVHRSRLSRRPSAPAAPALALTTPARFHTSPSSQPGKYVFFTQSGQLPQSEVSSTVPCLPEWPSSTHHNTHLSTRHLGQPPTSFPHWPARRSTSKGLTSASSRKCKSSSARCHWVWGILSIWCHSGWPGWLPCCPDCQAIRH